MTLLFIQKNASSNHCKIFNNNKNSSHTYGRTHIRKSKMLITFEASNDDVLCVYVYVYLYVHSLLLLLYVYASLRLRFRVAFWQINWRHQIYYIAQSNISDVFELVSCERTCKWLQKFQRTFLSVGNNVNWQWPFKCQKQVHFTCYWYHSKFFHRIGIVEKINRVSLIYKI